MKQHYSYTIITIFLLYIGNTTAYTSKYKHWEKEWEQLYQQYDVLIENPENLSTYIAQLVQQHTNIHNAITAMGLKAPFYFGASSSAYQVEGGIGTENSWSIFARNQNIDLAHNAMLFWEQYAKENPKKQATIREIIAKWMVYKDHVINNTVTLEDTIWARRSWEFIYGNPNEKTHGILEKIKKNKQLRKNIATRTEHKKIREMVGNAIDFWHRYPEDIQLLKNEFGLNALRISIEWSRIQPKQGVWNEQALTHYKNIVQEMKKNGIEPIIVLHHYTIPTWFENIGGFTKQENIHHFVDFALRVYEILGSDATIWSTFNAVEGYAFKGYFTHDGAPGLEENMHTTQQVMAHMLEAHVAIYKALKKRYQERKTAGENIPNPQIGLQKNIIPLDAAHCWNPFGRLKAHFGNKAQNDGFYSFFKTGRFNVHIPFKLGHFSYPDKHQTTITDAPYCLDWIGINHYSNIYMGLSGKKREKNPERMTINPNYRFYPEGLYRAVEHIYHNFVQDIEQITHKKIPMIITENGIAIGDDEKRRELFYQRALFTIAQTIKDGYTVIGYTPWSHADNYEWGSPYGKKRYGLLYVDFTDPNLPRHVKEGARYYGTFVKDFFAKFSK